MKKIRTDPIQGRKQKPAKAARQKVELGMIKKWKCIYG